MPASCVPAKGYLYPQPFITANHAIHGSIKGYISFKRVPPTQKKGSTVLRLFHPAKLVAQNNLHHQTYFSPKRSFTCPTTLQTGLDHPPWHRSSDSKPPSTALTPHVCTVVRAWHVKTGRRVHLWLRFAVQGTNQPTVVSPWGVRSKVTNQR